MAKLTRRWRYNDAQSLVDVPLSVDETTELLEHFDKSFLKDESQVEHFVLRVLATCRQSRELRSNFESEISRRTMHMPSGGSTPTMSPETAVQYLSDDQIEALFDRMRREQLEMLRAAQAKAEADSLVHQSAVSALETLVAELSTDGSVPASVRERVARALDEARHATDHRPDGSGGSPW
jgi:hypothetical protein